MADEEQEKGFAERMQGAMSSFTWFQFLLSDQPFSSYEGPYPFGLKKNLTSLLQMAKNLGFSENFEQDVIDSAINDLKAEDIMKVLYDPDRKGEDGKPAPMISEESFKIFMGDEAGGDNELLDAIIENGKGFFQRKVGELSLGQALDILKQEGLKGSLEKLAINENDTLLSTPLKDIDEATVAKYTSSAFLSNADMVKLLEGLPTERPEGEDANKSIIKQDVIDEIFKTAAEKLSVDEKVLRDGVGADVIGTHNISGIINKLSEVIDSETSAIGAFLLHGIDDADDAKKAIMSGIREKLPGRIAGAIAEKRGPLLQDDGNQISIRDQIGAMNADGIYGFLKATLENEKDRAEFLQIISDPETLAKIKEKIKGSKLGLLELTQLLPDAQFDEKASEALREAMKQMGFFEPLKGIFAMFMKFVGPILQKFAPGLHDQLMGKPAQEEPEGLTAEQRKAARGDAPEPAPDPATASAEPAAPAPAVTQPEASGGTKP